VSGARLRERAALAGLFVAGAALWVVVLSAEPARLSGPVPTLEDWPKEFRYYDVLRQAVEQRRAPLFLSRPILSGRKLLAVPEVNCTPAVLLLGFVSIPRFVLLDALAFYAIGFTGLLWLRRRYALGLMPFALLFLIFFFNGHLVAHMAVGHSMWAAHFLLPFFVLGVLALIEGRGKGAPALLALTLFAILLRGGVHLFSWCVLFLLLLAAFNPRRARAVLLALLGAAVLGMARLAPAAFLARHWNGAFLSGFPSAGDLWHALVSIGSAADPARGGFFGSLAWWEYDTYVGPAGLVLLIGLGLAAARYPALRERSENDLLGPMAVMAGLSLGDTALLLNLLPVPLLSAERVGSRLLLLPLVMLATLAALRLQEMSARWTRDRPRPVLLRAAIAGGIAATAAGLAAHAWAWRIQALKAMLPARRGLLNVDLVPPPSPLAGSDLAYVVTVAASALVTLAGLLALGLYCSRRSVKV
jgi:hypothetical protein